VSAPVELGASPSGRYLDLGRAPARDLEEIMLRGQTPDPAGMVGWEYKGRNVAFWAERSPILKFVKGFYEDGAGWVMGFNVPVVQNPLEQPWRPKPSAIAPKRFGFYRVRPPDPASRDNAYLHALLLDYSEGGNSPLEPANVLRDYLVRIEPGSDDLLLGKAYAALGPLRLATNYFVLERFRRSDYPEV